MSDNPRKAAGRSSTPPPAAPLPSEPIAAREEPEGQKKQQAADAQSNFSIASTNVSDSEWKRVHHRDVAHEPLDPDWNPREDADAEGNDPDQPVEIIPLTPGEPEGEGEGEGRAEQNPPGFSRSASNMLQSMYSSIVLDLPPHLHRLAFAIRGLNEEDLAYIADMTDTVAKRDVYSLLPYTGSNWFLPQIDDVEDDEPQWGVHLSLKYAIHITIAGKKIKLRLPSILIRVALIVLLWFMLWNILPHWLVEPGGYVWDPVVIIVISAIVGGIICRFIQIPPLVGVLWIAIMWNNIPTYKYLTAGIVPKVLDISSKLGLTVILARAGYSLTIKSIRPHWIQSVLLATMPFIFELLTHSFVANKVFHYNDNYTWAFLQGTICSIVSPAVVVPGALYLQQRGYGKGIGPVSLMLSAVGVEICAGVWAANFIIGLLFYDQKLAVAIVLGPVQLIGGAIIGVIIGIIYHYVIQILKRDAQRLPTGKYAREHFESTMDIAFVIMLAACFCMVFLGYNVSLPGGGAVMCVFFAATITHMWTKDGIKELEDQKKYVGGWLAATWDNVVMPILFALMGAKIHVTAIFNKDFYPKALICIVCSSVVRVIVIFLIQLGSGMPWREKCLTCVGYLGKASAQASVGPLAASLVAAEMAKIPESQWPQWAERQEWANNIQQISAMYVMFMAAVASVGMVRGGMLVLKREEPETHHHHSPARPSASHSSKRSTTTDDPHREEGSQRGAVEDEEEELARKNAPAEEHVTLTVGGQDEATRK